MPRAAPAAGATGRSTIDAQLGRISYVLGLRRDLGSWNEPAIGFYESLGAELLPDWRVCRLAGEALERAATTARP